MGTTKIHNLDQLEKEVYRLKLKSKLLEEKLNEHLDDLQHNAGSLLIHSLFKRKKDAESSATENLVGLLLGHDGLQTALNRVVGHFADKAAVGLDQFLEQWMHKKKEP